MLSTVFYPVNIYIWVLFNACKNEGRRAGLDSLLWPANSSVKNITVSWVSIRTKTTNWNKHILSIESYFYIHSKAKERRLGHLDEREATLQVHGRALRKATGCDFFFKSLKWKEVLLFGQASFENQVHGALMWSLFIRYPSEWVRHDSLNTARSPLRMSLVESEENG